MREMLLELFSECANSEELPTNKKLSAAQGPELQLANAVVVDIGPQENDMDKFVDGECSYLNSCSSLRGEG